MGKQSRKPLSAGERLQFWKLYGLAMLVALCAVALRHGALTLHDGEYLWAEDGNVFLNEAQALGLSAILKPYAGYFHLFPRLVAACSQLVPLIDRPAVLLVGWFMALAVMVHALAVATWQREGNTFFLFPLVALALLQPHWGEVFFSITNAQWLLGAALCLLVLADARGNDRSLLRNLALLVLALTGPFSIVLVPLMVLKLAIRLDGRQCWRSYLIVSLGAAVQLCTLLWGDRLSSGSAEPDPWAWIDTFMRLLFFGANDALALFAAIAMWLCVLQLLKARPQEDPQGVEARWSARLLAIAAGLFLVAALLSQKQDPRALIALNGGSRYTWIPYTLILASIAVLGRASRALAGAGLALFAVVCVINFHKVERLDLQFGPFARFAKVEDVTIPINPAWPKYPGWHVAGQRPEGVSAVAIHDIALSAAALTVDGLKATFSSDGVSITALGDDPRIVFSEAVSCPSAAAVGLNIHLSRANPGWLQLYWGDGASFSEGASLPRWYPAGEITAQFAFPLRDGRASIRFDPMQKPGQGMIRKLEYVCL